MDATLTDHRVVKETRLRTIIRSRLGSSVTWMFAIALTWFVTGRWEYILGLNVPIAIFAVVWSYYYERLFLRISWGIEK